jgi:alkylation response protein AidB-like acyl-CoA dehydrogenase
MDLEWSASERDFQQEVRDFLEARLTPELRRAGRLRTSVYPDHHASMAWQAILHERGWAAPAWPVQYGGCDWSPVQHYIFASECARADAPALSPMGISMVAHAIIAFGTEEQKQFYLPRMLSGEHFWCQGYSEPGAGSDLASLQMSAVADGDHFILNGSKIWTTHATEANWMFCLVRTSKEAIPQRGITFLLLPMSLEGITIRPLVMSSGEEVQAQVFFDNVRAQANVLGEVGDGWTVAKHLLEFERGGMAYAPALRARAESLAAAVRSKAGDDAGSLADDPLFQARLAEIGIRIDILEILEYRSLSKLTEGKGAGTDASMMKILGTELSQSLTELAQVATGLQGLAYQPQACAPGGPVPHFTPPADGYLSGEEWEAVAPLLYFNDRAGSIYAGSNEIQRNILAKARLGLR